MQAQLSNNSYIPGLNGGPEFTNWNWNMQSFQPPILGVPGSNNYGDFNFNNLDMSNFAESNLNLENRNNNSEKDINDSVGMSLPFSQHMGILPEQLSLMQQQEMMNKMNVLNPFMFTNFNSNNQISTQPKLEDIPASATSFGMNMNNDTSNQLSMKKERMSPVPFMLPNPYPSMPNYVNSQSSSNNSKIDSFVQPNNININNYASSSQSISKTSSNSIIANSNPKESIMPTPPPTASPFYTNPFSNPMQNFWGNNFMYNNASAFPPFLNQFSPFGGPSNFMNSSHTIGNPFSFPNAQPFNPFATTPDMAALNNGYFLPNFQQQNLFQQQQQEQFLAVANQQLQQEHPVIKQEKEVPAEACPTPKVEVNIKQEHDSSLSSHTDEEGADKLIKPRKSSKCQCPNCTNPNTEEENAKLIKKHACHWPGCPKTYGKTSHLKSHIRQHQGIRPFICPDQTCMKVFMLTFHLKHAIKVKSSLNYECFKIIKTMYFYF